MKKLRLTIYLLRYFGVSWLLFRVQYAVKQRIGWFKYLTPLGKWEDFPLNGLLKNPKRDTPDQLKINRPIFFFDPADQATYQTQLLAYDQDTKPEKQPQFIVNKMRKGQILYFSHTWQEVGLPPRWHQNPFTGQQTARGVHWSQISDFGQGDIKNIWEPSRFSYVYGLVRAYWRTADESIPALFWQIVQDWRENNPPNSGANWKCGQETTFRVMAWCFGLYGFLNSKHTTSTRLAELIQMIGFSGQRIEKNLAYALSQHNNHGVSEAAGLWMIGYLFPELKEAVKWKRIGRKHLESQARTLIYSDGAFSQQSFNYQRVMLHDYLWVSQLAELAGEPFSTQLKDRLRASADLLFQLQAGRDGELPNYGQNDGAYILPLSNCDYRDYRPLIQALNLFLNNEKLYPDGLWDEESLWLLGSAKAKFPIYRKDKNLISGDSGYVVLKRPESLTFTRCGEFKHRPAQADIMHFDLWWRGIIIAVDPGTYSYNDPEPWNNPLAESIYHNVVTVDEHSQMVRYGRFLWFPWVKSRQDLLEENSEEVNWRGTFQNSHLKWQRHVRGIGKSTWLICDDVESFEPATHTLHWLIDDFSYKIVEQTQLILTTPVGEYSIAIMGDTNFEFSVQRAVPDSPRGWQAKYYHNKQPALSITSSIARPHQNRSKFTTLFTPRNSGYKLSNTDTIELIYDNLKH